MVCEPRKERTVRPLVLSTAIYPVTSVTRELRRVEHQPNGLFFGGFKEQD